LIFSLFAPGISTTTLTSVSVVITSAKGCLSEEISGVEKELPPPPPSRNGDDLTLPNSLTFGLPSGPIVIE
jgi:hypothetical protein